MTDRTYTTTNRSPRGTRRLALVVAAAAMALAAGCSVPADADARATGEGSAAVQTSRTDGPDITPADTPPEGTVRKIGAEWFVYSGGEWSPQDRAVRTAQAQDGSCAPTTRKCFLPAAP